MNKKLQDLTVSEGVLCNTLEQAERLHAVDSRFNKGQWEQAYPVLFKDGMCFAPSRWVKYYPFSDFFPEPTDDAPPAPLMAQDATLRDRFAEVALAAVIRNNAISVLEGGRYSTIDKLAEDAYRYADHMLAARLQDKTTTND